MLAQVPYVRAVTNDPVIDVVGELLEVTKLILFVSTFIFRR
jgi:hypothetical protein